MTCLVEERALPRLDIDEEKSDVVSSLEKKIKRAMSLGEKTNKADKVEIDEKPRSVRGRRDLQKSRKSTESSTGSNDIDEPEAGVEPDESASVQVESEQPQIDANVEQIAEIRVLLGQGMSFLNENDLGLLEPAIALFGVAMTQAKEIGNVQLEARSVAGTAQAFSMCVDRTPAAPALYELAADMFLSVGELSDAYSCIASAGEIHVSLGEVDLAIECYQKHDSRADSKPMFQEKLVSLMRQVYHTNEE
mmetsp:Transcript_3999/g.5825  ORF Transcript_3999/g.5825 Transcript_3999/m.5825 type:complete len:249 (-) Transcript_3999:64-810(-)|eukprot:CAMPEP_0203752148 /NCGR_PEP_ID=MMETSP0098-20131031/6109_1 /ASSEMBLY_ACC=CAM_ASM_000208 /TAXON_ID=96639 /ORGANISM=" , Strain NY0313808BC1" /LENGTH=248 /DNA_ID=CAMNT_0050642177 /DNA_START=3242 /DNA_END=3988 /DNA_ORIENTATION=+